MWTIIAQYLGLAKIVAVVVAVVALVGFCGYYVYKYHHMQTQIVELQKETASLKQKAAIIEKAQKATEAYDKAKREVAKKNVEDDAAIDKMVENRDESGMRDQFVKHGWLRGPDNGATKGRTAGRP